MIRWLASRSVAGRSRAVRPSKFRSDRRIAALSAWLVLSACSALNEDPPANSCLDDSDCVPARCNTALGMCVAETSDTVRIGLEVRPLTDPYGRGVQPIAFPPFDISGPAARNLYPFPGVNVRGVVGDGEGRRISAELSFTRVSPIPGAPANTITVTAEPDMGGTEDPDAPTFLAQLLPGTHALTVTPTGEWAGRLPPLELTYETPEAGDGFIVHRYPAVCEEPAVDSDCLAVFEGRVFDRSGEGQAGVVVKLVDRISGRAISSRYVTASDLELDPGYFRLYFPVGLYFAPDAWFLQISPAPHRIEEVGPSPTYTRPADALTEVDGMIQVLSPNVEALRLTYSGTVETEDGRPLEGASLRFTSEAVIDPESNITGTYTTTARTDERGQFTVQLLGAAPPPELSEFEPARYDIVITPRQSESELGILQTERQLGASAAGQLFQVPRRVRFGGTVQTVMGLPMIDARVEARSRGSDRDGALSPVARLARSNQTTTDPMGLFDLRLDVGVYDLVIEPPAGTNFPWLVERDIAIGGADAVLSSVYDLDHPVPITGHVRWGGSAGPPVSGGEVRAYAVIESTAGTRSVLIGRATADDDGKYTLLLPPSF